MSSRAFACAGDDEREWGAGSRHMAYCSRGAFRPSLKSFRPRKSEGAGNAGCALHPRSRVPKLRIRRTRAYRFSGNTPASPAQWLYGLLRALPGDEFLFVTVVCGLRLCLPGWIDITSAALASATDARTTRLRRTQLPPPFPRPAICADRSPDGSVQAPLVRCARELLTRFISPCNFRRTRCCRVHRIPSRRTVTTADAPPRG
jgi:hypothetical protein